MSRNEDYFERPLPSSAEGEKFILGGILLSEKLITIAKATLEPNDFYNLVHRKVFEAMLYLFAESQTIGPLEIIEYWKTKDYNAQNLGWYDDLIQGLPLINEPEMEKAVKTVKKHSIARKMIFLTSSVQRDILEHEEDIESITKRIESTLSTFNNQLLGVKNDKPFTSLAEVIDPMAHQFAAYNRGESTGVKTGMKELDDKLDGGGLQANASYLIAAGEKVGKTSLVLGWAYDIAYIQKLRVSYITLEMSSLTLAKRLYSLHTGIPYYRFRPGFNGQAYQQAIEGLEEFSKIPISIADKLFGMSQIAHYLRREVEKGQKKNNIPVGAAFIDYAQIINSDMGTASNREREVANVSRGIKQLSSELGIPLITLSSINRLGLSEGQEPDASINLRDSGSLAFDAESVMLLHNPAYVPGKPYEPRDITDITLNVARQRNGPTARIPLKFIGKFMQFMTESQFAKHFGDPSKDKPEPKSTGQLLLEEKKIDDIWEQDDDEWINS